MQVKRKNWSSEEINKLKDLYENKGLDCFEIEKILPNRTKEAIWLKVKSMKFKHSKEQTLNIKHNNMSGTNNPMYGKKAWSNGLTKENCQSLKGTSEKQSIIRKKMFKDGLLDLKGAKNGMYGKKSWNNGLTTETSEILKRAGEKNSISKKENWKKLPEEEKQRRRKQCAIIGSKCKKKKTSIEIKIENLLKTYNIEFISNFYSNGFTFDFYFPKLNSVIECQGDYWHGNPRKYSEKNYNHIQIKNINRDKRKEKCLLENNIKNLFLWEYDINKNFEDVKNKIEFFIK